MQRSKMSSSDGNRRLTHERCIQRIHDSVKSEELRTATSLELESRIEFLDKAYAGFVEEHQRFVHWVDPKQFKEQDEYFAKVEKLYQHVKIGLRSQLKQVEAKEAAAKYTGEKSAAKSGEREKESGDIDMCGINEQDEPDTQSEECEEGKEHTKHRLASTVHRASTSMPRQQSPPMQRRHKPNQPFAKRYAQQSRSNQNDLRQKLKQEKTFKPIVCHYCNENTHPIFKCPDFRRLDVAARRLKIQDRNFCKNCLQPKEQTRAHRCTHGSCWQCGEFHNSLLCAAAKK